MEQIVDNQINGSHSSVIPDSLKQLIQQMIDEKVEEKMKVYELKYQEIFKKQKEEGSSKGQKTTIKFASEIRNGGKPDKQDKLENKKDQQEDDTPVSNRVSTIKKTQPSKIGNGGSSKARSDSKESS